MLEIELPERQCHEMTSRQISLVQQSFDTIVPRLDSFSQVFYARLFEQNPNLGLLFRSDRTEQERKFGEMLLFVIPGLARLEELRPSLAWLGRRHQKFGVRAEDYLRFWHALDWTLHRFLDRDYTVEVRGAWSGFFAALTGIMLDACEPALRPSE